MAKFIHWLSFSLLIPVYCCAQGGTWVWISGSDTVRQFGVYGIKRVPDINNNPGSIRDAATWIDKDDNLWLFGGLIDTGSNVLPNGRVIVHGAFAPVADMWKYDPVHNTWAWMNGPGTVTRQPIYGVKGVPDPANHPALFWGEEYVRWTDKNYNFWLYNPSGNCLWRYQTSNNQWAWIAGDTTAGSNIYPVYGTFRVPGANNHPGSRNGGGGYWVDNDNNLWLYGEPAGLPNFYSDVWRFDINLNQWAWMNGPQVPTADYCYGELRVEAPGNLPPGRAAFTSWADEEGNFYMFGGISGTLNFLNDLWKYNIKTNNWVWLAGDSNLTSAGIYNNYCEYYAEAKPQSRWSSMTPASNARCLDFFYLFGGLVFFTSQGFNDLWAFYPATSKWKWLSGSPPAANEVDSNDNLIFLNKGQPVYNNLGNYGMKGVPAPGNQIPARSEHCEWIDSKGNFWVYGGVGFDTDIVDIYYKLISFDTVPTRHARDFSPCCD